MTHIIQQHCFPVLDKAESLIESGDTGCVYDMLRKLTNDDFGALLYKVPSKYPLLKQILPQYPDSDTQKAWTGNDGVTLLQKTCLTARILSYNFRDITGVPLAGKRILDYGCGWGRILRQMFYFSDPDLISGVDPWDKSLDVCRGLGLEKWVRMIDYEPTDLPFDRDVFDLIYAFSVFTHVGNHTCNTILGACRKRISDSGVFAITLRPIEYWESRRAVLGSGLVDQYIAKHSAGEYVFHPAQKLSSTDVIYGETSIKIEAFADQAQALGWTVAAIDHLVIDPFQLLIFLTPA